jgi:hypothetical protein
MNHQKIYESIIQKAKFENRIKLRKNQENYIYYENHHIIPMCLVKNDELYNKVLLTPKEHFVCHKLLVFIYPNNKSIYNAFYLMCSAGKHKYNVSSRDYAYARELFVSIPVSKETGKKISNSKKGKPTKLKGVPKSEEHKRKIGIVSSNRSEESNYRCGSANRGKKSWMSTHKHTKESKEKNRQSHLRKKHTKESKTKISIATRGKNNPMYEKTPYDIWLQKFGKQIADKKENERTKKISIKMSGNSNKMKGRSIYDIWLEKYGKEIASIKYINWTNNLKKSRNKNNM